MNKTLKSLLISTSAIILLVCLIICGWFLNIALFSKQKATSTTFKVGELTLADGSSTNFIDVQYYANKDNSGLEAFEIKFNYFMDENREDFYSQGLQFVSSDNFSNISFKSSHNEVSREKVKSKGLFIWGSRYYNCQNSVYVSDNTNVFNYQEVGEGDFVKSTHPIGLDSFFKFQLGEKLAFMRFKGLDTPMNEITSMGSFVDFNDMSKDDIHNMYLIYNVEYFSKLLYESVKTAVIGANYDAIFEFGDLFWYYVLNENNVYERINEPVVVGNGEILDPGKIKDYIQSYYSIKIKTHEQGLQKAQDSLFNSVLGNANYNSTGKYQADDYFIGKSVIDCNIYSFDFVNDGLNNLTLKLTDTFINYHKKYKNNIVLNVVIDIDILDKLGYTFKGFENDCFKDFNILKCYSISNGSILKDYLTEVQS